MTTPLQQIRNTYYDVKYIELYDFYYTNRAKHHLTFNPVSHIVLIPNKEFMVNLMEGDELGPPKKALFHSSQIISVTKPEVIYDGFTRINVKKHNIECMDQTARNYWSHPYYTDATFYVKLYKEPTYLPSIGTEVMGYMVHEKCVSLVHPTPLNASYTQTILNNIKGQSSSTWSSTGAPITYNINPNGQSFPSWSSMFADYMKKIGEDNP